MYIYIYGLALYLSTGMTSCMYIHLYVYIYTYTHLLVVWLYHREPDHSPFDGCAGLFADCLYVCVRYRQ